VDNIKIEDAEVKKTGLFQKFGWKEILAIVFILIAFYFFYSQRGELKSLGHHYWKQINYG
jgi:hypothetical protein